MKKQEILEVLFKNPTTVFEHRSDWGKFTIKGILPNGGVKIERISVKTWEDGERLPYEKWEVETGFVCSASTRDVSRIVADSTDQFVAMLISDDIEREARQAENDERDCLRRERAVAIVRAFHDAGLVDDEWFRDQMNRSYLGAWGHVEVMFDTDNADQCARVLQLIDSMKVGA